jgi:hypothetical protein
MDAIVNHFSQLSGLPLGHTASTANLAEIINERPPECGQDAQAVLDLVLNRVLPQTIAQDHPRYFATIPSPSNFVSVVADCLASDSIFSPETGLKGRELRQWNLQPCGGLGICAVCPSVVEVCSLAVAVWRMPPLSLSPVVPA